MLGKRGQQLSEYAVMFGVAAMAFIGTQTFVSRRVFSGLLQTSRNTLGTMQPSDQGSSVTRSTETTRERGDRFNVHTDVVSRATGSSQVGFILAEARGPYLGEVFLFDQSSAMMLASMLCGKDCEDFIGLTKDSRGWITARFKMKDSEGKDKEKRVRFRILAAPKFDKSRMRWYAKIEAEIEGQIVTLNVEGTPKEIAKGRGIEFVIGMVLRAKGVKDWLAPYLGVEGSEEEEDVLTEALKELGINAETFEDGEDAASEVIQIVAGALGLSEKELLALAEDEQTQEALKDKLWNLSQEQLEDLQDKLDGEFEPLDKLVLKLAEQDPQSPLGMALTTIEGENIWVNVDDDDQDGRREIVGGFMDPNNPLSLRLDFDEDQDYEEVVLVVTPMGDISKDDLETLTEDRDERTDRLLEDAEKTLEREIPDEESREEVTGIFREYAKGPARKGFVEDEEDQKEGETFREYVDRRRQQVGDDWSPETEEALDRAANPDDPLHQALMILASEKPETTPWEKEPETLVTKGDDDFALLPVKDTIYSYGGKPVLIQEADGDFKLPEGTTGELVRDDETKLPLGINQDEDDELEIVFASGSGSPNVEFIGRRGADGEIDYSRLTTSEIYEDVQTDPRTGKTETVEKSQPRSGDMVVGINRYEHAGDDANDAEAWVVKTKVEDENGRMVDGTFFIFDSNHNHVLDQEDKEAARPIEVASKPVTGPDQGQGQGQERGIPASTLREWTQENQDSNNPVPLGQDGTQVDVGLHGVTDGLPEFIEVNGERVEIAWVIVEPTSANDLIDASDGVDMGEAAGAIAGALEDNLPLKTGSTLGPDGIAPLPTAEVEELPDDQITVEEVGMAQGIRHPDGFRRLLNEAAGRNPDSQSIPPFIWNREGEGSPEWTPLIDPDGELTDKTPKLQEGDGGFQPVGGGANCTTNAQGVTICAGN